MRHRTVTDTAVFVFIRLPERELDAARVRYRMGSCEYPSDCRNCRAIFLIHSYFTATIAAAEGICISALSSRVPAIAMTKVASRHSGKYTPYSRRTSANAAALHRPTAAYPPTKFSTRRRSSYLPPSNAATISPPKFYDALWSLLIFWPRFSAHSLA